MLAFAKKRSGAGLNGKPAKEAAQLSIPTPSWEDGAIFPAPSQLISAGQSQVAPAVAVSLEASFEAAAANV